MGGGIAMSKYQRDLSSSPASLSPWSFPLSVLLLPAWKYSAKGSYLDFRVSSLRVRDSYGEREVGYAKGRLGPLRHGGEGEGEW